MNRDVAPLVLVALVIACDGGAPQDGDSTVSSTANTSTASSTVGSGGGSSSQASGSTTSGSSTSGTGGAGGCSPTAVETCASALDENCDGNECAEWAHVYGDAQQQAPASVVVSPNGDTYVSGALTTMQFGGATLNGDSEHAMFLAKLSTNGDELWAMPLPNQGYVQHRLLATPDGGVLLMHEIHGVVTIAGAVVDSGAAGVGLAFIKLDPDGVVVWSKVLYGGGFVQPLDISSSGAVVGFGIGLGGAAFGSDVLAAGDGIQMFGFDSATGAIAFSREFAQQPDALTHVTDLAFDPNGDIVAIGDYKGSIELGGPDLPTSFDSGFIARFDGQGNPLASMRLCTERCFPFYVAVGPNGDVFIGGQTLGIVQFGSKTVSSSLATFVAGLKPTFQVAWLHAYLDDMEANRSMSSPELFVHGGELRVAFTATGTVNTGFGVVHATADPDLVIGALNVDGTPMWLRSFGSPGAGLHIGDFERSVRVGPSGEWTLAVGLTGATQLGTMPFASSGEGDVGIARLAP